MGMSKAPTPETDAVCADWLTSNNHKLVSLAVLARRLERERDEAREEITGWKNKWECAVEMAVRAECRWEIACKAGDDRITAERALADRLAESAESVVIRWETPNWKNAPATAGYIYRLRDILTEWKEARK
jgi:hypothetical protein